MGERWRPRVSARGAARPHQLGDVEDDLGADGGGERGLLPGGVHLVPVVPGGQRLGLVPEVTSRTRRKQAGS